MTEVVLYKKKIQIGYTDLDGSTKIIGVDLTIDKRNKSFSITSSCHDGAFRFQNNGLTKYPMWDALAVAIRDAIKEAKAELGLK